MKDPNDFKTEFDHPPTPQELASLYRKEEENDPASLHYKRHLKRPAIHPIRSLLICLFCLALACAISLAVQLAFQKTALSILSGLAFLLALILVFAKRILIWSVRCYQYFATDTVRNRCRFEPSCSEYMILSLEKYGLFRGTVRGIRRLFRCKPPFGGFDPP